MGGLVSRWKMRGNEIMRSKLRQQVKVNLFGLPYGLSFQGMKNLLAQAEINGDGVVDYEEFKKIWNPTWPEQTEEYYETTIKDPKQGTNEENIGFRVKNAVLFPWEVEKGLWPENYSLFLIMLHKLLSFRLYSVFFSPIIIP
ncbi:hypothetical protein CMV_009494 [Castanea mollissima]|uniref:EF-hand domain-containing protein n=1 Tax=Castanea mollissima TaxID=60419 RepID=A0A8J4RK75_9ROSI|nr:hypothetical protein CMV_009494 [Castanea mollissima]